MSDDEFRMEILSSDKLIIARVMITVALLRTIVIALQSVSKSVIAVRGGIDFTHRSSSVLDTYKVQGKETARRLSFTDGARLYSQSTAYTQDIRTASNTYP